MQLTARNTLHNTEAVFEPLETGNLQSYGKYAVIDDKTYKWILNRLCGMKECRCGKWIGSALGDDGKVYHITDIVQAD